MEKNIYQRFSLIIFWDFLMIYQIFFSLQVERCAIITYKHGIYKLPHELPNGLRLMILGKLWNIRKLSKVYRMMASAQVLFQKERFLNTRRNLLKKRNLTLLAVHHFTPKLELVSVFCELFCLEPFFWF